MGKKRGYLRNKKTVSRDPKGSSQGEKNIRWNSTFGEISVVEVVFKDHRQQYRPFSHSAGLSARCCSQPLQRVLTDFGADDAFGKVPLKLKEHYGIELSSSTIRKVTLDHAKAMLIQQKQPKTPLKIRGNKTIVGEIDGCMVPVVEINEEEKDQRKGKTLCWKEARLALAHEAGSASPKFAAIFGGSTDEAGKCLLDCAIAAQFDGSSQFHGVGDGAPWIATQVADKFEEQGQYLLDFYHVCEYLAEAASSCAQINPEGWINHQKKLLKQNKHLKVLENLRPYIENDEVNQTPVKACYRYLNNRLNQLDYQGALEKGLPIGSGEIESAHRYVIQKRLKLSGAWWKAENINPMLALRVIRANEEWNQYWDGLKRA